MMLNWVSYGFRGLTNYPRVRSRVVGNPTPGPLSYLFNFFGDVSLEIDAAGLATDLDGLELVERGHLEIRRRLEAASGKQQERLNTKQFNNIDLVIQQYKFFMYFWPSFTKPVSFKLFGVVNVYNGL